MVEIGRGTVLADDEATPNRATDAEPPGQPVPDAVVPDPAPPDAVVPDPAPPLSTSVGPSPWPRRQFPILAGTAPWLARDAARGGPMRVVRIAVVVLLLVAAVVISVTTVARVGPPSEDDLIRQAGLIDKDHLLIGVKDDQPGVGYRDPRTGLFTGFDIDIAYLIAADLGFRSDQVTFVSIESEDRARRQARTADGKFVTVDLVIASYSITKERAAEPGVTFAGPYLTTEQSVLTLRGHPQVKSLTDLAGKQVCTLATATSGKAAVEAGDKVIGLNRISDCVTGLERGQYVAVTTDAAILAGFVAKEPTRLRLNDIGIETNENWGVNTGPNKALAKLVDLSLYRSLTDPRDRRWEDAYDKNLLPEQPAAGEQQVAIPTQPTVAKPDVWAWPWERSSVGNAG